MRILFVLGSYLPEKSAGIENYSHQLAKLLLQYGHAIEVAILESQELNPYCYEDVKVIPLKNGFGSFVNLIQENNYDICHFQEYSAFGGIEMFWIKAAGKHCKTIYFTFHLPYFTCYKNDFRYYGLEDCHNFSSAERCVKCVIATKMHFSKEANLRNSAIALLTPVLLKTKKIKALRRNVQINTNNLDELLENCDKIFVIANWFKNLLAENGFGSEKIKFIPSILKPSKNLGHTDNNLKRKILFAGRIEKQKGLHLLCMAMRSIKTIKIELDVFGNIVDENYFKQCEKKYAFNFKGSISREELLSKLHEYDFLILPSVFTEMYSMILQESIYSHLPVIASSAKGNTAAVKENKNGFIFNYDDDKDLARVIDKAYYLKQNGWKPEFETNNNAGKDLSDILSFYS